MEELNWMAEYAAFAFMLGLTVIVGLYYGCVERKQNTVSEYLLGGKNMSVIPITISLIASHLSGVMLLGVPSEIYLYGTQYLLTGLVNVVVIVIVIYIYLPVFYELQLTSVYEYLQLRFNSQIRSLSSLIFALHLLLYIPIVIYTPAIAFNQVSGIHIHTITPIICMICIFYTTIGGLKAVVWTDAIQSVFTVGSFSMVIVLGVIQVGGVGNMMKANQEGDRIEMFRMNPDPFMRNTFWTVGFGSLFNYLTNLGIHAGAVQRFIALPTYYKARKALIYFIFGLAVIKILIGAIGMLIYANYKDCDPILSNHIKNSKSILPYYVMDVASNYPGLTGFFISGIVSASLSTMSAQLNTVSGTIYEDFFVNKLNIHVSELKASIIMKCTVMVVGFICVILVFVVEKLKGITQLVVSLAGVTNGALLSAFTLGMCCPWANSRGTMCGMLVSLGVMIWIVGGAQYAVYNNELKFAKKVVSISGCPVNSTLRNQTDFSGLYRMNEDVYVSPNVWKIFTVSYMHHNTIGTVVGLVVGLVVSWLFPTEQNIDPKLLTPFVRKFVNHKKKTKSNANNIVTNSYLPVAQDTKL